MESDKDHIKDIFSSKFSNFEPDLPELIWDKIASDLPVFPNGKSNAARKSLYRAVIWASGVAAAILAIYFVLPQGEDAGLLVDQLAKVEKTSGVEYQTLDVNSENSVSSPILSTQVYDANLLAHERSKVSALAEEVQQASVSKIGCVDNVAFNVEDKENVLIADNVNQEDSDSKFEKELNERIAAFEAEGKKLDNMFASNDVPEYSSDNKGFQVGVEGGSGFSKSNEAKNKLNNINNYNNPGMVMLRTSKMKLTRFSWIYMF